MPYYVYITTNVTHSVLYVGMTGDLLYRAKQHREKLIPGFTHRYNVSHLVYYEEIASAYDAITREKQLKAGPRRKKMELADSFNPRWRDFYEDVVDEEEGTLRLP